MASRNRQCECTSIVVTRLPLTMTGLRLLPRFGCLYEPCAYAASIRPQVQNTTPDAAALLMNSLRVVIARLLRLPPLLGEAVYDLLSSKPGCHEEVAAHRQKIGTRHQV